MNKTPLVMLLAGGLLVSCAEQKPPVDIESGPIVEWNSWAGKPGGGHYSPLEQIDRSNVKSLEVAWVHRSGDYRDGPDLNTEVNITETIPSSSFQATPLVIDGTLYYCTPYNRVYALDPETGEERWMFDPQVDTDQAFVTNCRGVSSWRDQQKKPGEFCQHRILAPTLDARILSLDAKTGERCDDFGGSGEVALVRDLGEHSPRDYAVTSPPAVIGDTVITGAFVIDAWDTTVPAGVVRAFDARTGALRWAWNPVAPDRAPVDDEGNYVRGTTNVWSVISVDDELNLVYVPTGNSSPDYYGGHREGHLDHYSSSVVALNATTGKVEWSVQTVHHDIWDFDVPSQPTLVDLNIDGETVPALVQLTKMGLTWVLDRRTGEPLFEIEERAVPQTGAVEGEYLSATQPFPVKPDPLHPLTLTPDDAWGITPWDKGACRDAIANLDHGPIYTPISSKGTVLYPAPTGGNNWGSPAIDPNSGLMIASAIQVPMVATLRPRKECTGQGKELPQTGTPYCIHMKLLASPLGAPCTAPPWGTLAAVDLTTGDKQWEVPLGSLEGKIPLIGGLFKGSPGFGGPLLTKSGLVFVAASSDYFLRVFDASNGEELVKLALPTQSASVPMTYRVSQTGRQYVVLSVGGHWAGGSPAGDHLMAFALKAKD